MDAVATGLPARAAALRLLDAVLRRGQPLESALAGATKAIANPADRAMTHAISAETLRRLTDLDALIDNATRQRLPDDAKARMVLRIALVQALSLGTPHHAVVATALPLVAGGPRRLVHGVLGALLRKGVALPESPTLPSPVEARWNKAWGMEMITGARQAVAKPPPLDLTLCNVAETAHWAQALGGTSFVEGHIRINADRPVSALPGFAEGAWWVQNLAASLPSRLLGTGKGRTVLDLCAAPGGKTMQLAASGWNVIALDNNAKRIGRIRENLSRTRLEATLIEADLLKWKPAEPVDAILLDAPCTATGIFARHPDVLHRIRASDIADRAALQTKMLARAGGWLKPGGILIYATCSLEPEEGEEIARGSSLATSPITKGELPAGLSPTPEGWLRILPGMGMDGFFVARFTRG